MSDPFHRNNHFVSRCYLEPWETASDEIWTYRILVPHEKVRVWKPFAKKAVAWHAHLYTQITDGQESDEVERWFDREFESPAKESLKKATNDERLSSEDWNRLVRFLAAQDVRTPAWFTNQMKRLDETLPGMMKTTIETSIRRLEEASKSGNLSDQLPQLPAAEREGFPIRTTVTKSPASGGEIKAEILIGRQLWVWSMKRALTRTISALHHHRWTILRPANGMSFVTSDNPVTRLNYKSESDYNFNGGWGSPRTNIILPLGPQHLLFTQIGDRPPIRGERMSEQQTQLIRRFTVEHASRLVFAHEADKEIPVLRPRFVSRVEFERERQQWATWHNQQTAAEREMGLDVGSRANLTAS
jgi:hypothetical protein